MLSDWISGLAYWNNIIPKIVTFVKSLCLRRPKVFIGGGLTVGVSINGHILKLPLFTFMFIAINLCCLQPWSEKLLIAVRSS